MSVYIRGMEMPKSCDDCPLGDSLSCQLLPGVPALWREYTNAVRENRRHSDCPLVPVPPHGRLGDLDELAKIFREDAADDWNKHATPLNWSDAFEDVACMIDDAPTIILADKEDT